MKNITYEFSNTQIQLPQIISEKVLFEGKNLVKKQHLYKENQGYEDNPHITILYGIHSDSPPLKLIDAFESYPKFTIRLGLISLFKGEQSDNEFDVVKIDVDSTDLHVLNQIAKDNSEYTNQYSDYKPHVTIAYVKKDTCDHLTNNPTFNGLSFVVDRVLFSGYSKNKREIFLARK